VEVKAGYKQIEVGVIPEDWEVKSLAELFVFRNGVNADKGSYGQGIRFINVLEPITYSHIYGSEITGKVTLPEHVVTSYAVRHGDVLFNRTSETQEEIGLAATYLGTEQVVFGGFVIRGRPIDQSLDPIYSGFALRAPVIRSQIIKIGQGAIRANIGQQNLSLVLAPVPPLLEQRAIAAALSDVDALIRSLDRLIDKKRDLKQAAMLRLLTGKTRLPGFGREWEVKRLGDVIKEIGDGGTPSTTNPLNFGGPIHWVVIDDIRDEIVSTKNTLTERGLRACAAKLWQPGTLILSTGATIGEVGIARVPVATKQGICGLVFDWDKANTEFFKYWFIQNKSLLLSKAQGSSIKEVRAPTLVKFEILLPDVPEQTAIAALLSDMNAEIAALERRRDKTRALKHGMMQELLTGKIRLV
jgi:type I restriction enzyme S subunit